MDENKDPIVCPKCETVSPWLNTRCRSCGELLPSPEERKKDRDSEPESEAPATSAHRAPSADSAGNQGPSGWWRRGPFGPGKPRLSIQWVLVGMLFYLLVVTIGEFAIVKWMVAPNPELRSMVEQMNEISGEELSQLEKDRYKSMILDDHSGIITAAILLFLIPPLLFGAVNGFFSDNLFEAPLAMGLSIFAVLLAAGAGIAALGAALVAGPLNAGLGALGAFGGRILRQRLG